MQFGVKTLHEINSQPDVWQRCLQTLDSFDFEPLVGDKAPRNQRWVFVGCGTSYYLAQAAAASFSSLTGVFARAVPASEFLLFPNLVAPEAAGAVFPVLISRSGHTSEVLQLGKVLKQRGVEFLAITCDGNELAQLTARTLRLPVIEQSTVMSSSFTSMLMSLQYIAARLANRQDFIDSLRKLPEATAKLLKTYDPAIRMLAQKPVDDVVFLAQGALYPIASETALKVMESSSSYAQFFHSMEFRHGPKSIVSDKVLVGGLISETGYAEESAVLLEMKELGANTLAIANRISRDVESSSDLSIELDLPVPELARLIVYVVFGQLLGSYMGLRKGLDPDSPRNLSRVVTLAG